MRPVVFEGMKFGKMCPMDGDAILDIKGKGFLFFEIKCRHAPMSVGQRLTLQHLVDNTRDDRMAVSLVCDYADADVSVPINMVDCTVRQAYYDKKWHYPEEPITAYEYARRFADEVVERFGVEL